MKHIDSFLRQKLKHGMAVCGDFCLSARTHAGTLYVLCDGVGSGVYANIAAIACAERIKELWGSGASLRSAAETVASSMHRARTEDVPFSAFSAAHVLPDGHFTAYAYEAPKPILIQGGNAAVLQPRFYTAGYEVVGESLGHLGYGDTLLLASDGVTQAGLGHGYVFGIGEGAVAGIINRNAGEGPEGLAEAILAHCMAVSGGRFEDDTTVALLGCREARELNLFTGPPSKPSMDREYAKTLQSAAGKKVVCGSTTMDIFSRELKTPVQAMPPARGSMGALPEYYMEGVDLSTEGAITLSQVCNVLDEPSELLEGDTSVKRLCIMLKEADAIHVHLGRAVNDAHENIMFKQIGVHVRRMAIQMIEEKLRAMGKLVTERYY